jgi:hypothetical protein
MPTVLPIVMPTRSSRFLATAFAALSLSACDLGWDCGTARSTIANGTVRDATNATLATVEVNLAEDVGPSMLRLSAGVMGPAGSAGAPLRGHVTRARLVTEAGELIADIPTGTTTLYIDAVVALNTNLASRDDYEHVRRELFTTRAKVILETDLPGREIIETTLRDVRDVPGNVQRCRPA